MGESESIEHRRPQHAYTRIYIDISMEVVAWTHDSEPSVNVALKFIWNEEKV